MLGRHRSDQLFNVTENLPRLWGGISLQSRDNDGDGYAESLQYTSEDWGGCAIKDTNGDGYVDYAIVLLEQGVDTVFGYPGGAILNIYDELYKHSGEIRHVLTSHEQGASHAADGYARATGKVGVCIATSGPGATNLVTGIATAMMDSVPVVAITANVGVGLLDPRTGTAPCNPGFSHTSPCRP